MGTWYWRLKRICARGGVDGVDVVVYASKGRKQEFAGLVGGMDGPLI